MSTKADQAQYFSDVDSAGHAHGPDSAEVAQAAARLDRMLGQLMSGAARLNLTDRLHIVVVSDHGMAPVSDQRVIYLDDYLDLSKVVVTEWTPMLGLASRSGALDAVYNALNGKHPSPAIYTREETPARFHYRNDPRIPPIVGLAEEGWTIATRGARSLLAWPAA